MAICVDRCRAEQKYMPFFGTVTERVLDFFPGFTDKSKTVIVKKLKTDTQGVDTKKKQFEDPFWFSPRAFFFAKKFCWK